MLEGVKREMPTSASHLSFIISTSRDPSATYKCFYAANYMFTQIMLLNHCFMKTLKRDSNNINVPRVRITTGKIKTKFTFIMKRSCTNPNGSQMGKPSRNSQAFTLKHLTALLLFLFVYIGFCLRTPTSIVFIMQRIRPCCKN